MAQNTVTQSQNNKPAVVNYGIPDDYDHGIAQEDVKIPSIILMQKMTELMELDGRKWKAGQFYDMGTDTVLDKFDGLVVKYYLTTRLLGEKDPSTGRAEIVRFSSDGTHWDDNGEIIAQDEFKYREDGRFAKKTYHYLVLRKGCDMPAMVTFKGASAKMGKSLNMHLLRVKPMWRVYFQFASSLEESGGNKYHVLKATPKPKAFCDQKTADLCKGFWEMSTASKISSFEMNETSEEKEDDPVY